MESKESEEGLFEVVVPNDIPPMPREMEEDKQAMVDELWEVNLSTEDEPNPFT